MYEPAHGAGGPTLRKTVTSMSASCGFLCYIVGYDTPGGIALRVRMLTTISRDFGKPLTKMLSKLVGLIIMLGTTPPGEDHAGGGDSGETGESQYLPAGTHQFRSLLGE